jgi:hypothetical protein
MREAPKAPSIRRMQSDFMGTDVVASINQDKCCSCGGPATEFKDDISRREFSISGLCQTCQDGVFNCEV